MYRYYNKRYLSRGTFTLKDTENLINLEKKIDSFIKGNKNLNEKGAFIRLSGRSPKDGDGYDLKKLYNEYLNKKKILKLNLTIVKKNFHFLIKQ